MKIVAFFDVDDTLIDGQTQKIMASYLRRKGKLSLTFLFKIYSWFLLYKTGLVSDVLPIMQKSYRSIKGIKVAELEKILHEMFIEEIEPRIFPQALEEIKNHQLEGHEVVLVSNSIEPLVKTIKERLSLSMYIATSLESKNNVFTGELKGSIIYEQEKLQAIKKIAPSQNWNLTKSYAYSDHYSDIPLLEVVGSPVAVNPDDKLRQEAQKHNWPILHWKKIY